MEQAQRTPRREGVPACTAGADAMYSTGAAYTVGAGEMDSTTGAGHCAAYDTACAAALS